MDWGNVVERALWTFVQGALANVVVANVADIDELKSVGLAALVGGVAALLSFIKTVAQERLRQLGG